MGVARCQWGKARRAMPMTAALRATASLGPARVTRMLADCVGEIEVAGPRVIWARDHTDRSGPIATVMHVHMAPVRAGGGRILAQPGRAA